jgi:hypothetical protein
LKSSYATFSEFCFSKGMVLSCSGFSDFCSFKNMPGTANTIATAATHNIATSNAFVFF